MKYGKLTFGQMEAIVNKLGGMEGVQLLLQGELIVQPRLSPYPKNENTHYVLSIVGKNLPGEEEIAKLEEKDLTIKEGAREILTSAGIESYNEKHCLEDNKRYNIVLIPGREIPENRTSESVLNYAKKFGYKLPLAGLMPRILEFVPHRQMEQMDIKYIAALHQTIPTFNGDPHILITMCDQNDCFLREYYWDPTTEWNDEGAFPFVLPEN